jgi:hypothetical protein
MQAGQTITRRVPVALAETCCKSCTGGHREGRILICRVTFEGLVWGEAP